MWAVVGLLLDDRYVLMDTTVHPVFLFHFTYNWTERTKTVPKYKKVNLNNVITIVIHTGLIVCNVMLLLRAYITLLFIFCIDYMAIINTFDSCF